MKILVIGGAGYIGSHVCREFLDAGHEIVVFDNLSSGRRVNLFEEERFVMGDILHTDELIACAQEGFDALVHLAASKAAGESMIDPGKYAVNNITGTINILNAAVSLGIRRIVFSSSAAVYGEPEYLPIDENHRTSPENFYGFTKLEIERLLFWYDKLKNIRYATLRYFNAAGYDREGRIGGLEQNPANLLPVIMEVATGKRQKLEIFGNDYDTRDGTGIRDYVHTSDLAAGHLSALEYISGKDESIVVNLGSESGISVLEMVETARRVTGKPIPATFTARRPGDPAELVSSAALAFKLLGWTAKQSDVESLISTSWEAYKRAL